MNGEEQKKRVVAFTVSLTVKKKLTDIKEEMGATWEDFVLIALDLTSDPDLPKAIVFKTTPEIFKKIVDIRECEKKKGWSLARLVMAAYGVEEPKQDERSQTGGE